jgi:hypothetical protein
VALFSVCGAFRRAEELLWRGVRVVSRSKLMLCRLPSIRGAAFAVGLCLVGGAVSDAPAARPTPSGQAGFGRPKIDRPLNPSPRSQSSSSTTASKTTYFGGGELPSVGWEQLISLARKGRHKVTFWGNLADNGNLEQCGAVLAANSDVTILPNGSFSASGAIMPGGGASNQVGTYSVSGRFKGRDEAVGTARAKYTAGNTSCDTDVVYWHDYAPSVGLGTGHLARDAVFGGITSQADKQTKARFPIVLRLNHAHTKVAEVAAQLAAYCKKDPSHSLRGVFTFDWIKVNKGRFHAAKSGHLSTSTETVHFTTSIHGRFRRHRVTGDWKLTAVFRNNSDGSVADTCGGGNRTWQASRRGP